MIKNLNEPYKIYKEAKSSQDNKSYPEQYKHSIDTNIPDLYYRAVLISSMVGGTKETHRSKEQRTPILYKPVQL